MLASSGALRAPRAMLSCVCSASAAAYHFQSQPRGCVRPALQYPARGPGSEKRIGIARERSCAREIRDGRPVHGWRAARVVPALAFVEKVELPQVAGAGVN
jgi:hypothetical protein